MSDRFYNPLLQGYRVDCAKCGTVHGSLLPCPPVASVSAPAPDALGDSPVARLSRYAHHLEECASEADAEENPCTCGYVDAWNAVFSRSAPAPDADGAAGVDAVVAAVSDFAQKQLTYGIAFIRESRNVDALREAATEAQGRILDLFAAQARAVEALEKRLASTREHAEWTARTADERITDLRARLAEAERERDKASEAMKLWSARAQELAVLAGEHEERAVQAERERDDAWLALREAEGRAAAACGAIEDVCAALAVVDTQPAMQGAALDTLREAINAAVDVARAGEES